MSSTMRRMHICARNLVQKQHVTDSIMPSTALMSGCMNLTSYMAPRRMPTSAPLHRHRSLDGRPWIIAFKGEVLVSEIEDALHIWIQFHDRKRTRLT